MGTGAWGRERGDGSVGTGAWGRERGDGSVGTGAWGRERGDRSVVTGARGREQGNVFYFILGIRAWQRNHGDRVLGKGYFIHWSTQMRDGNQSNFFMGTYLIIFWGQSKFFQGDVFYYILGIRRQRGHGDRILGKGSWDFFFLESMEIRAIFFRETYFIIFWGYFFFLESMEIRAIFFMGTYLIIFWGQSNFFQGDVFYYILGIRRQCSHGDRILGKGSWDFYFLESMEIRAIFFMGTYLS